MTSQISTAKRYSLIRQCFGGVLAPHGFTTEGSKKSVFWRKTDHDVFHYVVSWRALRKPKYDILAFAHSPLLDDEFSEKHPDQIGCPIKGYVHSKRGVGIRTEQLFCRTEEGLLRDFEKRGKNMLIDHAIPFLDKIQTIHDLAPLITAPGLKKNLTKQLI